MPILVATVAILGLAVGSFLNVVIYRVPRGESIVHPGSHCPNCDAAVRTRHNVPVLGWLMLRGRCKDCANPIGIRYPLVELTTAVLFIAVTVQVAHLDLLPALPAYLFFAAVGVALSGIDLDVMRLPDVIVYPAYAALAVLLGLASVIQGGGAPMIRALVGGTVLFTCYLALAIAYPGGMGLGDVKLAGVIGAALGYLSFQALIVGAFAAFLIGGVVGTALTLARRAGRKSALPFGPFMITGALVAIFASAPLVDCYVHLVRQA